jgi:acetyl esterase
VPLDPAAAALLPAERGPSLAETGAVAAREAVVREFRDLLPRPPAGETLTWHERAPGRPAVDLLVCRPARARSDLVVLHLHGGGWVVGDPWWLEPLVRRIAARARATVVSVDYRRAPEHRYPAALDDARTALRWAQRTFAELPLVVLGESAGGTLAASLALRARDDGARIAGQCLLVPALDPRMSSPSWDAFGTGYGLDAADMRWYWEQYLPRHGRGGADDPHVSPLRSGKLRGLPPAVVLTCGYDPLQDEGRGYAEALRGSGVAVSHLHRPDLPHGFAWIGGRVPAAAAALDDAVDNVRSVALAACAAVGHTVQRHR